MSDLVAITYADEATAEAARNKVLEMQTEYLISLEDAVVVVKDADGRIKLNQLVNPTAAGAASGSFWGFLVGLIFMMPIAGVLITLSGTDTLGNQVNASTTTNASGFSCSFQVRIPAGIARDSRIDGASKKDVTTVTSPSAGMSAAVNRSLRHHDTPVK